MDSRKELNPEITLDDAPMDPKSPDFKAPVGWSKEEISFYFDTALKVLNSDNFTTAPEYVDLLVNQCQAEQHWSDAFTHFLTRIKEMGLEIETDQQMLRGLSDRMFYWRTVRMMIHAAGLIRYEDEIMKYEIAKFYQPTPQMLPQPRTREVPIERRRKAPVPTGPKQSILKPEPRTPAPPTVKPVVPKPPARINKPTK